MKYLSNLFSASPSSNEYWVAVKCKRCSETIEAPLPCVVTAQKGLNEPRYPSLPGIMKAKRKELKAVSLGDLGADAGEVGAAGALAQVAELMPPPERAEGKVFEGEIGEIVPQVVKLLRDEAKVI